MLREILFCKECYAYTLKKSCPICKTKTTTPKPAKYSPEDKYGKYRRIEKKKFISLQNSIN